MTRTVQEDLGPLIAEARAAQTGWIIHRARPDPGPAAVQYVTALEALVTRALEHAYAAPGRPPTAPCAEGELWDDLEPRSAGRVVEVRLVDDETAIVRTVLPAFTAKEQRVGHETEVHLSKFHNHRERRKGFALHDEGAI